MRKLTLTTLTALAVFLVAAGGVVAHGSNDTASHDREPENASTGEWAAWMEQHMTAHIGVDAAAQMQDRMSMSYEEMDEQMAAHHGGSMMDAMMNGRMMGDMMNGGMSGMGCH